MTPTQENVNKHTDKRILVLGSAPHTRLVTAYTWDNLPQYFNVADYDIVILNLEPLLDEELARGINLETLPSWQQFAHLLFSHDSEIIVIGIPGIEFGSNSYQSVTWWLPLKPRFFYDSGEEIRDIEPEFAYYFRQVRCWFFHASIEIITQYDPSILAREYLPVVHPKANDLRYQMRPLAQTRFQQPIAFELKFHAVHTNPSYFSEESQVNPLRESGRVIWLPRATEISDYDAVNLILQERYGLQLEQAPPDWVEAYKLPEQIPIEEEISHYEQEIQRLKKELTTAQQHLQDASRFRKLLYEQGVEGLEPIVRDALRELGATVNDPPPKENREDGRLTAPTGQIGMLEIKGRTKSLSLDDVRQLDQWVRDALIQENLESKGILIANMYCGHPPELRKNPFPPNCVDRAKRANLCLMTTTQLFQALCSYQREELDVAEFWNTIFNTDGVCPLPELEPLGSEQCSDASSAK